MKINVRHYILGVMLILMVQNVNSADIDLVSLISPTNNSYINGTNNTIQFTFNWTGTGQSTLANCTLTINSTSYGTNTSTQINITNIFYANNTISEATHYWNVTCSNNSWTNVTSVTNKLTIDTTKPIISFSAPINGTTYTTYNIDLNYSATDLNGISACWYSLDSGTNTTLASCGNTTLRINNGLHNITVYANDSANNVNSSMVYFTISVFPNYINNDIVLNSTQVDGNQTIGHYVINASNIVINLNSSILTRNLTWFDGSTIFSSNGFTNVTIRDGKLNWTDFGKVRLFKWYVDNRSNSSYSIPDGTTINPFYAYLINGLNETIYLYSVYADGQCKTYPTGGSQGWYTSYLYSEVKSGDSHYILVSSDNPPGGLPAVHRFKCIPAFGTFNFWMNVTYNTSTDSQTRFISGNISGYFADSYSVLMNEEIDNGTQSNDFILTNSSLNLINITYSGSKYFRTNFSDSASNLSVGWYLDVQVNDSLGNNLSNANVTATDKNGVVRGNGTTDSSGRLRFSLPEYVQNSTGKDWKSNYTINITKAGYTKFSSSINLTGNTQITLNLSPISIALISVGGGTVNNSNISDVTPDVVFSVGNSLSNYSCENYIGSTSGFGTNTITLNNTNTTLTVSQILADGVHSIFVRCSDSLGGYNDSATWSFNLTSTNPEIYFKSPTESNNTYFNRNFVFVNVSLVESNFRNLTFKLFNSSYNLINLTNLSTSQRWINWTNLNSNMEYYYNATECLTNGLCNYTETRKITSDSIQPNINLTSPADGYSTTTTSQTLVYFPVDTNLNYCEMWDNYTGGGDIVYVGSGYNQTSPVNNASNNFTRSYGLGTWQWNIKCVDKAGNWNFSANRSFTITTASGGGGGGGGGGGIETTTTTLPPVPYTLTPRYLSGEGIDSPAPFNFTQDAEERNYLFSNNLKKEIRISIEVIGYDMPKSPNSKQMINTASLISLSENNFNLGIAERDYPLKITARIRPDLKGIFDVKLLVKAENYTETINGNIIAKAKKQVIPFWNNVFWEGYLLGAYYYIQNWHAIVIISSSLLTLMILPKIIPKKRVTAYS